MQVLRGHTGLSPSDRGSVVALGNFDGVHLGHRRVLSEAASLAEDCQAELAVAVFDPHPRRYFAPDTPPFRLMSEGRRNQVLSDLGVKRLHVLPFDASLVAMTPDAFVARVLVDGLGMKGVVTGADFRFGAGRAGSVEDLQRLSEAHGAVARFAALHDAGQEKISSTRIRDAISAGNLAAAGAWMGGPWIIDGRVARGDQVGRTIGFPTANIDLGEYVRPASGVYAVRVGLPGEGILRPGVANFGRRPTVDGTREWLEVHLFDFGGDLYDREIAVEMVEHLRPERRFDGLDALKAAIAADADQARAVLNGVSGPS
ncbi:bifunctional riboflavin kinase/FAD synthetase [Maricaulis sp. CAU 1757]